MEDYRPMKPTGLVLMRLVFRSRAQTTHYAPIFPLLKQCKQDLTYILEGPITRSPMLPPSPHTHTLKGFVPHSFSLFENERNIHAMHTRYRSFHCASICAEHRLQLKYNMDLRR